MGFFLDIAAEHLSDGMLSEREVDFLEQVAVGHGNREIGEKLSSRKGHQSNT